MATDPTILEFSTDRLPDRHKRDALCDVIGKQVLKVDVSVPGSEVPSASIRFKALAGAGVTSGALSRMRFDHAAHLSDDDDIVFLVSRRGRAVFHQRGAFAELESGSGTVMSNGERASFQTDDAFEIQTLRFERERLRTRVRDLESRIASLVPVQSMAKLLTCAIDVMDMPRLDHDRNRSVIASLYDLAAVALGADPNHPRLSLGIRAARLRAIKTDIVRRLAENVTAADLARRHGISERYIQKLFLDDGTTLSEFILNRRIEHAQQALHDPRFAAHRISDIAFGVGFADLSHFNRVFRRRFGFTPSEARAKA